MTDGSATIGATLRAGLSDIVGAARDCWAALAVAAAIGVVAGILPSGARTLAGLLVVVIAQGALLRRAFGREGGLKGLRWGRDEWRLLAAQLMIWALLGLIGAILMVVVGGVALGVARTAAPDFDPGTIAGWRGAFASAGPAGVILVIAPLASLAILIWLGLRLSFAGPATVDQAGVRVLSAFPLTRDRAPVLFIAGLAIVGPPLLAGAALTAIPGSEPAVAAAGAVVTSFYTLPVWTGALVHLYRLSAVSRDA